MTKIYLQTHQVASELPSTEGEGGIYTNKSWITKEDNWGLVFLVTTGTREEYQKVGFEQDLPKIIPSSKRIYFLWEKFEIEQVQHCGDGQFFATGNKRHQIFTPFLLLNETLGFEEFRKHYMTSGLINLAKNRPPYLQTLLKLGGEA